MDLRLKKYHGVVNNIRPKILIWDKMEC